MTARLVWLSVSYGVSRRGIPAPASFQRWAETTLYHARQRQARELCIRIVDTDEARRLNRNYRHKDYATNVLAFPAEPLTKLKRPLLGDLAICAPVVGQEAIAQGKPAHHHWAHLTVHGVLHLLGYDHLVDKDAKVMEHLETQILATLGIADPYITS